MIESHSKEPPVLNPAYGDGQFVRAMAIRQKGPRHYILGVEDSVHAFWIEFHHDDKILTQAKGQWLRAPFTSCTGAPEALQALQGTALTQDLRTLKGLADSNLQCTHLFDALRLGLIHAAHQRADRRYDVIVPDQSQGIAHVRLLVDGQEVMAIDIRKPDMILEGPAAYAGRPILRGFGTWATALLDAEQFEKFFMLQRALFVSSARQIDMPHYYNRPATDSGPPMNSCFGAQEARYRAAIRQANTMMHSMTPDMLLHFLHP